MHSMSRSNAEELLMYGLAAAKSGDPREYNQAEYYLEWVLRTDADLDQQTQAWYWLSRITDDPVLKRDRLEGALAIRPGHADARRDLAVLDGKLKVADMRANPTASGAAVAPNGQIGSQEVKRFKCPRCGAMVSFQPGMGALNCQFCGTTIDEAGQVVEGSAAGANGEGGVSDEDWVAGIYTEKGHRWALPQSRVLECQGCGAKVTFSPARVSARCVYCASPYTAKVVAPDAGDLREPDGIVPFRFDFHQAAGCAHWWLKDRAEYVGVPGDLPTLAALQMPEPTYLPFWSFDIAGEVRWSGWVREGEWGGMNPDSLNGAVQLGGVALGFLTGSVEVAANNLADMVASKQSDSLIHREGAVAVILNQVLVPATRSLPAEGLRKLNFEVREAMPYRDDVLADWPAEIYSVSMADASLSARAVAVADADRQIETDTGRQPDGSGPQLTIDRTGLSVLSYKLLLLPVWTVNYTYKGEVYRLLVNGQTGFVAGETPSFSSRIKKLMNR